MPDQFEELDINEVNAGDTIYWGVNPCIRARVLQIIDGNALKFNLLIRYADGGEDSKVNSRYWRKLAV